MQERLRAVLDRRLPRYFELLREMVGINSFTQNPRGVDTLGALTAETFSRLGFSSEKVAAEDPRFGHHLVLTRDAESSASGNAPQIGLISHLDTVFTVEEERRHNFVWREEGDRLYGPGTVDIKGGTVVAYMMLDALKTVAPEAFGSVSWKVILDAAEEQAAEDFGALCLDHLDAERTVACLVFEGGRMRDQTAWIVVARKGMAVFEIEIEGRAAHAGSAHSRGASAVLQLAEVIQRIESWTDYDRELAFNVGVVEGGTVVNRVPHKAKAWVEMRAFDTEVFDQGMAKMMTLHGTTTVVSAFDGYPCQTKVKKTHQRVPWSLNPGSQRLFDIWREVGLELDLEVKGEERGGLSDGNLLWHRLPTVDGMGPMGANAHCSEQAADGSKEQEYATRSSFVTKALLNAMGVLKLLHEPG